MGNCKLMSQSESLNITPSIIFTRYLYLKDEVLLSLTIALILKKESALYWAFEVYHSGFEEELFQHLLKVYYDFFYTLNPAFQEYFIKKHKEWLKSGNDAEKEKIIALIVGDLLIRPHNMDVFILRQGVKYISMSSENVTLEFRQLLEKQDYLAIADFIFERKRTSEQYRGLFRESREFFQKGLVPESIHKKWKKTAGYLGIDVATQLMAFVMQNFTDLSPNIKQGKKLYISVNPDDIVIYHTIFINEKNGFRSHRILPAAYRHKIDEDNYLSLFQLERNKILMEDPDGLRKIYWYNWEYYASFSPVWYKRIQGCKGVLDHQKKTVKFPDNEEHVWPEKFYHDYGYEPDEQSRETQHCSIEPIVEKRMWRQLFEDNSDKCIFKPSAELLDNLKCVVY